MAQVRVQGFSISLDGYGAGPDQDRDHPLGRGGERLHEWIFRTAAGRRMIGREGGETGLDNDRFERRDSEAGATIIGRNMFGPVRGPWPDAAWTGWWGDDPPYHHPVFVLTHHPRASVQMRGGTVFHFVTDGIGAALDRARAAASGRDVVIGGGVATIRAFLAAGLIDQIELAVVPTLLGRGERLFQDPAIDAAAYECREHLASPSVIHLTLARVRGAH